MAPRSSLIAVLVALMALASARTADAQTLEYAVKANYLVRFAAFVDWPATAFADGSSPLAICVVGHDPFGSLLDRAAAAQTARGRRLLVRRLAADAAPTGCQIVYLGVERTAGPALDGPVLVVTDQAVSARRGAVHFVVVDNRVRFHIDQRSAVRGGLTISSRLLDLALSVQGRG